MNKLWIVGLAALAIEGVALACSCITTDDPTELQGLASDAARNALALVEVEAQTSYVETQSSERMLVHRVLAGQAPAGFQVERVRIPSSGSCDVEYQKGQRALVILYPSTQATSSLHVYRTSGLCTTLLLEKPAFRDSVARQIGIDRGPERG